MNLKIKSFKNESFFLDGYFILPGRGGVNNGYGNCWWWEVYKLLSGLSICGNRCIGNDECLWLVIGRESNKFNVSFVVDVGNQDDSVLIGKLTGIDAVGSSMVLTWCTSDGITLSIRNWLNRFSASPSDLSKKKKICKRIE